MAPGELLDHQRSPDAPAEGDEPRHTWRILAILSVLTGFASISTNLFLPAIPTIAVALKAGPVTIELASCCGDRSATVTDGAAR